jgi:ABC-type transporter Mla subunit MlaD
LSGLSYRLFGFLPNLRTRLAGGASRCLAQAADSLARSLPEALPELPDPLAEALAELPDPLTQALAKLAYALSELTDCAARPERLACRVRQPAERFARRSARLDGLLCSLSDVVECLRQTAARPEGFLAELADAADGVVDGLHQALEDLGVAIERRQRPVEDVVEILEAHLQPRLHFDALDVDLDLAQVHVHAGDDLQQVCELRSQRQMSLELLDVDVDLVDVHLLDVDEDVWIVARLTPLELLTAQPARILRARNRVPPPAPRPTPVGVFRSTGGSFTGRHRHAVNEPISFF